MANVVTSLIGSDLDPADIVNTAGPAATVTPNPSANNTQATLRRCYGVSMDALTTGLAIDTGLPLQAGLGSFSISLTPSTPLVEGLEVYVRQIVANYAPTTGVLTIAGAAGNFASFFVTIDLAHTVTR